MQARKPDVGPLPEWDLGDLYPGRDSPAIERDLTAAGASAERFEARYAGRLADLDGDALGEAIAEYEAIDEILGRIMSYASLTHAGAMDDAEVGRFFQTTHEQVTEISTRVLFFTLELNRLDDAALAAKMEAPAAARYAPWVRDQRVFRPHQLSDDLEKLLHEKSVAGRAAWIRLFDETVDGLRFAIDGKELTCAEALHLLSNPDGDVRRDAGKALGKVFGDNLRTFALITNTLIKDKEIEDKWRGFAHPISSRNL
ncbi:MAG: oligoendopeptidase F, partial [Alphaproteobacteria bacterium]